MSNRCYWILVQVKTLSICLAGVVSLWAQTNWFNSEWQLSGLGFNFPEGPAWNGRQLLISNCYSDWLAIWQSGRIDTLRLKDAAASQIRTNGLAFHQGRLYACDFGLKQIILIEFDGGWQNLTPGITLQRPNDLTFDAQGNLYFTDSGVYSVETPTGAVWCIRAVDGQVVQLYDKLAFPNGIAVSPDGRLLYVAESARQTVVRFPRLAPDKLGAKEQLVALPGGDPDGLACDSAGNLYVAHFGGGNIYVIAPDGKILQQLKTPGRKPSNLEFGGEDLRTLFLTEDETNSLFQIRTVQCGAQVR